MRNETALGRNRTGAQMSPLDVRSMETFASEHSPAPKERSHHGGIAAMRSNYAREADLIGSVPLPGTLTGVVSTGLAKLTGKKPEVLVDKLGERLAFERTGVRLYEAMLDKVAALSGSRYKSLKDDLQQNRDEEMEHMDLCASAIESLGADPTAQTPCADTGAVALSGLMQVLTDPRTTVPQCLNALLTAELADNANWELLIELTEEAGQDSLVPGFRQALDHETEHARRVRHWLSELVLEEAS